jgi:hypothetical protein
VSSWSWRHLGFKLVPVTPVAPLIQVTFTTNRFPEKLTWPLLTADAAAKTATEPGLLSKAWQGTKDIGSDLMDFAKDNPYGAMMIGQTAAPIAEYLSGKTDAEIAALEAQTGYADQRALQMQEEIAREKRRRENLSQGYAQVNTGINVNPNASMAQQGLIAQQLQQA